ncbi:TetR/AcrR family transcriptional regulator [Paraconexibacter algicola]|uniref:HTH tetR-type domain-containing protein n=1 Tax=Paraconexibacter algicola TaxID=2133960 RepID=A0A2T4UM33_9ACTN|nr:TetR family transcriptional regulator [Paraconexibacter algicola]PTL60274.1 hypothetical protein C7Y72_11805 [Paraconexibacter algicola]
MSVLSKRPASGQTAAVNRDSILEATVQLLGRGVSYAEVSVAAIAAEASISRPTFYAYFVDKRDLILALGARFERRTHVAADAWLELRDDDLHSTLRGVLEAFRGDHATLRAIVEASTYDPEVAVFWREFHARFIEAVVERASELTPDRPAGAIRADAFALVWMTQRSLAEHLDAPQVEDEDLLAALVRLWRSVLPEITAGA